MSDNIKILKNYLLYFLLIILVFMVGISGIFADEIQNIGYITNYTDLTLINTSFGMTYDLPDTEVSNQNFTIQQIDLYIDYSFGANKTYLIEISTPLATLQNIDRVSILSGNTRCSYIGLESDNINFPNLKFTCPSSVNSLTISLYNSNGNAITSNNTFRWNYTYLREIVPTIDIGPIINNQTQNTQEIINNNNTNTNNIINNQNANTDKIIDNDNKNFQTCRDSYNLFNKENIIGGWIATNGNIQNEYTDRFGYSRFIEVKPNTSYILDLYNSSQLGSAGVLQYDSSSTLIQTGIAETNRFIIFTTYSNTKYVRFTVRQDSKDYVMFNEGSTSLPYEPYGVEICTNKLDEQTNAINGLNDSLNDDDSSGASSEASEFFSSFTTNTFGLTSIVTAPLNLIQSLSSSTCSVLHLPLPYLNNKYLDLPCMTSIYQTHFGSFFTMYQTITYGIIAYWVCVRIFNQVKDFKNPEHDEIEVVDL